MNSIQLTGRLTRDPELSSTPDGTTAVCRIRLAVDGMGRGSRDAVGYIDVTSFGPGADAAARVISEGWLVGIDGRLEWHEWTDAEDKKRQGYQVISQIEFLAAPKGADAAATTEVPADTSDFAPVARRRRRRQARGGRHSVLAPGRHRRPLHCSSGLCCTEGPPCRGGFASSAMTLTTSPTRALAHLYTNAALEHDAGVFDVVAVAIDATNGRRRRASFDARTGDIAITEFHGRADRARRLNPRPSRQGRLDASPEHDHLGRPRSRAQRRGRPARRLRPRAPRSRDRRAGRATRHQRGEPACRAGLRRRRGTRVGNRPAPRRRGKRKSVAEGLPPMRRYGFDDPIFAAHRDRGLTTGA